MEPQTLHRRSSSLQRILSRLRFLLALLVLFAGVPLLLFSLRLRESVQNSIDEASKAEELGQYAFSVHHLQQARNQLDGPQGTLFQLLQLLGIHMPTREEILYREAELHLNAATAELRTLAQNPQLLSKARKAMEELPARARSGELRNRLHILECLQEAQTRYLSGSYEAALQQLAGTILNDEDELRVYRFIKERMAAACHLRRYRAEKNPAELQEAWLRMEVCRQIDDNDRHAERDYREILQLLKEEPDTPVEFKPQKNLPIENEERGELSPANGELP